MGSSQLVLYPVILIYILIELNTVIVNLSNLFYRVWFKPAIHLDGDGWVVSVVCWKGAMIVHILQRVSAVGLGQPLISINPLSIVRADWVMLAACNAAVALISRIIVEKQGPFYNKSGLLAIIKENKFLYWLKKRDNPDYLASSEVWTMLRELITDQFFSSLSLGLSRNQTSYIYIGPTNCLV